MQFNAARASSDPLIDSIFGSPAMQMAAGTKKFPASEMRADVAYQIVHDELLLDGNARQNLATFCQTWEDENVHKLMDVSIDKNWIDKEEYPQSAAISLKLREHGRRPLERSEARRQRDRHQRRSDRAKPACSAAWR